ncbi:MAG TPA: tetratricopeptide repeat protein [Bacteroidales bacterium]|nr:tetratricopeptide repeat protein [Bacteroidales bacterium]
MMASGSPNFDTIIKYSDQAILLAEKLGIGPEQAYVFKGFGYLNSGMLASALECFFKAAGYYRRSGINAGLAAVYTYISEAYSQQGNYDNARSYFQDAAEIFRKEADTVNLASTLHNLGYTYYCMRQYDTALVLFQETSAIYKKLGLQTEYAYCLGNTGLVYSGKAEYSKAEYYLLQAIEILTRQGDERAVTQYMIEYAGILQNKGEIRKAISCASSGFHNAEENKLLEFKRDAALRLSSLYQACGRYDSAYHFQSVFISANDSIKSVRNIQRMADLRTEFEVAKKQAEVDVLRKNKLIQLIVIISLALILILAIGIILLYYHSLKKSQRLSAALDERRKLLEEQSIILKEQREELRHQKEEIISSINYARYIQSSILPEEELLESLLGEHFVLYLPKDIVSGDFYWISGIENKVVVAAGDCTGHGVPGAFMSMLGTALLNEIVNKEYITHPGVILRHLRKEVINSLQQKGDKGGQKDGMDIAVCTLDRGNMKLQFAGAINPLYLVREAGFSKAGKTRGEVSEGYQLYEISGDLMPIGFSDRMDHYTLNEIDIFKGDTFYMFSDGYPDQFGGSPSKKFGYRKFRELLLKINSLPMSEQKGLLEKVLKEWMFAESQIDDIMVMGFRIS